jgi:hypothetical protein
MISDNDDAVELCAHKHLIFCETWTFLVYGHQNVISIHNLSFDKVLIGETLD